MCAPGWIRPHVLRKYNRFTLFIFWTADPPLAPQWSTLLVSHWGPAASFESSSRSTKMASILAEPRPIFVCAPGWIRTSVDI